MAEKSPNNKIQNNHNDYIPFVLGIFFSYLEWIRKQKIIIIKIFDLLNLIFFTNNNHQPTKLYHKKTNLLIITAK